MKKASYHPASIETLTRRTTDAQITSGETRRFCCACAIKFAPGSMHGFSMCVAGRTMPLICMKGSPANSSDPNQIKKQ